MLAKCLANRAEAIPQYRGVLFFDLSLEFSLTVGSSYPVLGMELYRDILQVLVPDNSDFRRPQWMPSELFDFDRSKLPSSWYFVSYPERSDARQRGFRARWGYRQLVESDEHRDGLEALDPHALAIFAAELAQADGQG